MTDIVEFLRARYADDRRTAEDAVLRGDTVWRVCENSKTLWGSDEPDVEVLAAGKPVMRFNGEYNGALAAAHVILHSPAAVLADIDAKLRIVDEHAPRTVTIADFEQYQPSVVVCSTCSYPHGDSVGADEYRPHPCTTLRLLALPFAGHTDYDQRWRPADV